jgi:hypothetical protein
MYSGMNFSKRGDKFYRQFQNYPEEGGCGILEDENKKMQICLKLDILLTVHLSLSV